VRYDFVTIPIILFMKCFSHTTTHMITIFRYAHKGMSI